MGKIVLLTMLVILCTITSTQESPIKHKVQTIKRADFKKTLTYILNHEGYYANQSKDKGGETYGGISRVFNPNWYGWRYVDEHKKQERIKNNTRFPELDFWVLDYYLDIWVDEHFYELNDQSTANYVMDFRINGTVGAKLTRRVLNDLGCNLPINNTVDSIVIANINSLPKKKFLNRLRLRRHKFYNNIVKRDTTQKQFLSHWIQRSNAIND